MLASEMWTLIYLQLFETIQENTPKGIEVMVSPDPKGPQLPAYSSISYNSSWFEMW